jgi:hypothetical protein
VIASGGLLRRKKAITGIVLHTSGALDPASAGSLANYQLVDAGRDGRFGTPDDKPVRLRSAAFDAAQGTIILTTASKNAFRKPLRLTVRGLRDALGHPVGDFVATVTRRAVTAATLREASWARLALHSRRLAWIGKASEPSTLVITRPPGP